MPQWADAVSHYTTTTASSSRARRFKRLPAKLSATSFVDATASTAAVERSPDSLYGAAAAARDDDSLSPQRPRSRVTESITKAFSDGSRNLAKVHQLILLSPKTLLAIFVVVFAVVLVLLYASLSPRSTIGAAPPAVSDLDAQEAVARLRTYITKALDQERSNVASLEASLHSLSEKHSLTLQELEQLKAEQLVLKETRKGATESRTGFSDVETAQIEARVRELLAGSVGISSASVEETTRLQTLQLSIEAIESALQKQAEESRANLQQLQERITSDAVSISTADMDKIVERTQQQVSSALERYSADKTQLVDYALETSGGSIISSSPTHRVSVPSSGLLSFLTIFSYPSRDQREIIRPDMTPGHCWPMDGSTGWVIVKTLTPVRAARISVEHIAPEIAPQFNSAPKDFRVFALVPGAAAVAAGASAVDAAAFDQVLVGKFGYQRPVLGKVPTLQQFDLQSTQRESVAFNISIDSNYGNPSYTCIYRLRIHSA